MPVLNFPSLHIDDAAAGTLPAVVIAQLAEEENADLVIMSPQRHRGWRHLLFGAITDQVTRLSPCPVLSIAPPQPSKPWRGKWAPLQFAWPRHRPANI